MATRSKAKPKAQITDSGSRITHSEHKLQNERASEDSSSSDSDEEVDETFLKVVEEISSQIERDDAESESDSEESELEREPGPSKYDSESEDSDIFFVSRKGDGSDDPDESRPQGGDKKRVDEQAGTTGKRKQEGSFKLASTLATTLNTKDLYVNVNAFNKPVLHQKPPSMESKELQEIMKKSVICEGFEKQHAILPYKEGLRSLKKQRKAEREKTKGRGWFDLPAPEMTEQIKNNLTVLKMRKVLDPKRFYKGDDTKALPKYFQMGRVVETAADFYSSRIPKKERKATLVDELLADAEFRKYNKKKYAEIIETTKRKSGKFKHMKRLKKRKR